MGLEFWGLVFRVWNLPAGLGVIAPPQPSKQIAQGEYRVRKTLFEFTVLGGGRRLMTYL